MIKKAKKAISIYEGGINMEMRIETNTIKPKDRLKELALRSKSKREQMKSFIFTEKDNNANANFEDLEKEVYFSIK